MNDKSSRIQELVDRALDLELNEQQFEELNALLESDVEACEIYLDRVAIHTALNEQFASPVSPPVLPIPKKQSTLSGTAFFAASLIGSAIACFVFLVWFANNEVNNIDEALVDNDTEIEFPIARFSDENVVAVVKDQVDARWVSSEEISTGSILKTGTLVLEAGMAQLDFPGGAQIILEGPATINLRGSRSVTLLRGKASCYVSELGKGFEFIAGETKIIDLGTAFSAEVGQENTDIQVNDGEIEIYPAGDKEKINLTQDKAIRYSNKQFDTIIFEPNRYPNQNQMLSKKTRNADVRFSNWKALADSYSNNPKTLLHYRMDERGHFSNEVSNAATLDKKLRATNGLVIGAEWVNGRWPTKKGLLFQRHNDHLMTRVPGDYEEATMFMWIKPNAFSNPGAVLIAKETPGRWKENGFLSQQEFSINFDKWLNMKNGAFQWLLRKTKYEGPTMHFPRKKRKDWDFYMSDSGTKVEGQGQWMSLAITYSMNDGSLILYMNGKPTGISELKTLAPINLDFLGIGNYCSYRYKPHAGGYERFLGVIDEVLISSKKLSNQEVLELHEIGLP